MYRKNTAGQFFCFQGVSASTGGILSGVTWTVRRCIDGTFAAATGTVTEDSTNGWYKMALSQADTNGNDISFNFTGTGAVPQTVNIITTACDPTTATNFGITGIPAVASGSAGALLIDGTGTAAIANSSGKVLLQATQTGVTIPVVTTVGTLTTYTGDTPQTGDSFARIGAAGAGLTNLGDTRIANLDAAVSSRLASASYTSPPSAATILSTAITEAYRAKGAAPTLAQFMSELLAHLGEKAIVGTTLTINKLDGVTAAETFTLNSATTPTAITRAT